MNDAVPAWFPIAFPFLFVGMWLLTTTMLGFMSGWFTLQQWYPDDRSEEPLLKLGGQSGSMGAGVSLGGILTLRAYRSGLGVGIWRLFGPFQKSLRIPWSEITAEPTRTWFTPMVKLSFGGEGSLKISAHSWSRLVEAAKPASQASRPAALPVSSGSVARGMLLEWLVITGAAATFFYFASRSAGASAAMPIEVCIGFPALVFGIGQLVRYARHG